MKGVYAKPISEKIIRAKYEAEKERRVIEKIILTHDEMSELKTLLGILWVGPKINEVQTYAGVQIEEEP